MYFGSSLVFSLPNILTRNDHFSPFSTIVPRKILAQGNIVLVLSQSLPEARVPQLLNLLFN